MTRKWMLSAAPLALCAFGGATLAQAASAPDQSPAATENPSSTPGGTAAGSGKGLAEIIVTAQRKSESQQKAAVAVDVIGGGDLVKNSITEPTDLGFLVPALTATQGGLFMRGVGNFTTTAYADPAIAFNYDGVYIGRISDIFGYFFDLQRVEVLKGPQGTLYGRNATGGAINVLPELPKLGAYSGYLTASAGNYAAYRTEAAVNIPFGNDTAVRVSGNIVKHDGYLTDGTQDEDQKALRVQLLHRFSPDLTIRIAGDYEHVGGAGVGANYLGRYTLIPGSTQYAYTPANLPRSGGFYDPASQAFRGATLAAPVGRDLAPINDYPYQHENFYGLLAEVDYDTPIGRLIIEPEYRKSEPNTRTIALTFPADDHETDEQYSIEARLQGKRIGIFDYTIGGLYYHEKDTEVYSINQQALAQYSGPSTQYTRSVAAFARITAHLTDALRVVGGARYTDDYKTTDSVVTRLTLICLAQARRTGLCPNAPVFNLVPTLAQQTLPYPAQGGAPVAIPGTGVLDSRSDTNIALQIHNGHPTFRGAVEYDLGPRSLAYASVETGFRSGGFNTAVGYYTYNPEYITAYTLGSKNRFFNNKVQLNLEAFYWKYKDQQLQHLGVDATGAQGLFTQNIGSSVEKGVEIEARYLVTPDTVLSTDVQYLHAEYGTFIFQQLSSNGPILTGCALSAASATTEQVNCSGKPVYNSPKFTLNFGGQQTIHFGDYELIASADTQYKSKRYVGFEYLNTELAPSVWQTNAQLTFEPTAGRWSIQAYIQNIENNRYDINTNLGAVGNILASVKSAPRTFGGRVSMKF